MDRRQAIAALLAAAAAARVQAQPQADSKAQAHDHSAMHGPVQPINIVLIAYPKMTALDLLGPQYMLSLLMGAKVIIAAETKDVVVSDSNLKIIPDVDFASCPRDVELFLLPGGTEGTTAAMNNTKLISFVKELGERSKYVSSVCTGSLILGKAGLLKGYKATSHWMTVPILEHFGATPVRERYVFDRNRITGAGVTAGMDTALEFVKRMRGEEYAKTVALLSEYDPAPPVQAGNPKAAGPGPTNMLTEMFAPWIKEAERIAKAG